MFSYYCRRGWFHIVFGRTRCPRSNITKKSEELGVYMMRWSALYIFSWRVKGLESYIYSKCIYAILLWCLHIHGSESIAGAPMMDYDEKVFLVACSVVVQVSHDGLWWKSREGHCPLYFFLQSRTYPGTALLCPAPPALVQIRFLPRLRLHVCSDDPGRSSSRSGGPWCHRRRPRQAWAAETAGFVWPSRCRLSTLEDNVFALLICTVSIPSC